MDKLEYKIEQYADQLYFMIDLSEYILNYKQKEIDSIINRLQKERYTSAQIEEEFEIIVSSDLIFNFCEELYNRIMYKILHDIC